MLLAPIDMVVGEEPFAREKLCPVLAVAKAETPERGIEAARAVVRLGGNGHSAAIHSTDERVIIITDAGEGARFGIVVDELCGHQQVVVKSIEESYGSVPGIAGATILGNGRVAFIVDIEKLSELLDKDSQYSAAAARTSTKTAA